jgi:hypothetical protein
VYKVGSVQGWQCTYKVGSVHTRLAVYKVGSVQGWQCNFDIRSLFSLFNQKLNIQVKCSTGYVTAELRRLCEVLYSFPSRGQAVYTQLYKVTL